MNFYRLPRFPYKLSEHYCHTQNRDENSLGLNHAQIIGIAGRYRLSQRFRLVAFQQIFLLVHRFLIKLISVSEYRVVDVLVGFAVQFCPSVTTK